MKIWKFNVDQNFILIVIAIIVIAIGSYLAFGGGGGLNSILKKGFTNDEIAKKSIDYLNSDILKGQSTATLISVGEESGLVKIKLKVGSNEFDTYATKDGKLLFPQAFTMVKDVAAAGSNTNNNSNTQEAPKKTAADIKKVDKPILEAYVVSRCPFGLQMQRVMADIVKNAPSLAENMKVRYMGSVSGSTITSMHGDAEAKENLRQICIREEQPKKYWDYVGCQMKASGQEVACEKSTGVDSSKLSACIADTKRGVAYAQEDFDLNTKYNVTGSPTLIMQDGQVSEFDFGGRTSEAVKSLVCAGFSSQPSACSVKLNTASAATSFSATYASATTGSGNSGANGANCAPAQ